MKWQLEIRGWLADDSEQVLFDNTLPSTKTMKLQKIFLCMRGLAVVEMAVVIPVFLIMVFGILEFGIVLYDKAIITNASLQLAQAGSQMTATSQALPPTDAEITKVTSAITSLSAINNVLGTSLLSFQVTARPAVTAKVGPWDQLGYPLTVTVSYTYTSLVLNALVKLFSPVNLPNPIPLSSTTTMYLN